MNRSAAPLTIACVHFPSSACAEGANGVNLQLNKTETFYSLCAPEAHRSARRATPRVPLEAL
jgi:hypothetical protein